MKRIKYPRTSHLPWSTGATEDDVRVVDLSCFEGRQVVVTEKLDGENGTIYPDGYYHGRSLDGRSHQSQSYARGKAPALGQALSPESRAVIENLHYQHFVPYDRLRGYLYLTGIFAGTLSPRCVSWEALGAWADRLHLPLPPVLYLGLWDEKTIRSLFPFRSRVGPDTAEGYVVRVFDSFPEAEFSTHVAKFVSGDFKKALKSGYTPWKSQSTYRLNGLV